MRKTKIVFLGAGSLCFGINMMKDIFSNSELTGSTLALVDIDQKALDRMFGIAVEMNRVSGLNLAIEKHLDRRDALPGAEFVINAVAIDKGRLWKQDFLIPKKYGIRHVFGENGGPGALFFTLRTVPLIMDISRDVERFCPEALFMNLSNPESRVILALSRYTSVKAVGLCHGIFIGHNHVARIIGLPYEDIEVRGAGINHFQWLLDVRDAKTGMDLYPLLREKDKSYDQSFEPFSRRLFRYFGKYPSCGDNHVAEYLPYGWEAGEEGPDFNGEEVYRRKLLEDINDRLLGKKGWAEWLTASGERAVDVITAVIHNRKRVIESGIVYNNGVITNLPSHAAVEVPIEADCTGVHPVFVGDLPEPLVRILVPQIGVQQMAVEAAVHADKTMALQALLIDPVVNSMDSAVKLLDELWEINREYIRPCI